MLFLKIGTAYVCVYKGCMWLIGEYLVLYISKINKDRNTKFYTQISVLIIFPGSSVNQKTGSGM